MCVCVCERAKWHSDFIGFRFCINFHRFFFSFHFILFCYFYRPLWIHCFSFSPLTLSHCSNLVRSTFCPVVLEVLVQYARLYGIIYESPIRYKLFTSYTTKYRHRYTDTTRMVLLLVMASVCTLDSCHLCASLSLTLLVQSGLVWFRYRSAKIHKVYTLQYSHVSIDVEFVHKITHLLNFAKHIRMLCMEQFHNHS